MEYGLFGKKYVLRTFEGEITLHCEREDLPKEEIFEKEQELLKQVHERKNVLVGGSWRIGRTYGLFRINNLPHNNHFWRLMELIVKFLSTISSDDCIEEVEIEEYEE